MADIRLATFFPPRGEEQTASAPQAPYTDLDIHQISALLKHIKTEWSRVPRTYIVLRLIGQLHLLDDFLDLGFNDHWLPVIPRNLPGSLDSTARANFVQAQSVVLTKAIDIEKGENGLHQNFARGEPIPFETKGILGAGGFGQ